MITVELSRRLHEAGLAWTPGPGDRFVMADPAVRVEAGLDDVFVVSEMTVDVADTPSGPLIRFNGTTEWALDSIDQSEALWVPAEHQLRELLGDAFAGLAPTGDGYRVTLRVRGGTSGYDGSDPAEAYAQALLHLLTSQRAR